MGYRGEGLEKLKYAYIQGGQGTDLLAWVEEKGLGEGEDIYTLRNLSERERGVVCCCAIQFLGFVVRVGRYVHDCIRSIHSERGRDVVYRYTVQFSSLVVRVVRYVYDCIQSTHSGRGLICACLYSRCS